MKLYEEVLVCALIFVYIIVPIYFIDKAYHHYQEEHLNQESNEPKDLRPKIPDCGMSTWDEIRGECNATHNRHTDNGS